MRGGCVRLYAGSLTPPPPRAAIYCRVTRRSCARRYIVVSRQSYPSNRSAQLFYTAPFHEGRPIEGQAGQTHRTSHCSP